MIASDSFRHQTGNQDRLAQEGRELQIIERRRMVGLTRLDCENKFKTSYK